MCGLTAFLALQQQQQSTYDGINDNHDINGVNGVNGTKGIKMAASAATPEKEIDDSLEIIKHRGPDARGSWVSPDRRVGLGHVRLSIIDLSPAGNQPFHDSADDVHAIVNGEIYNHAQYRERLRHVYNFQGNSDCEVVLALYKQYGQSFIQHLRGEFALVLWDARRKLLIAGRDRFGIKSLYWTLDRGRLLVATEMKSFLAYGWKPQWDVQTLRENGWRFDARAFFKGVYKVLPGHYLVSRQYSQPEQRLYWDPEFPDKRIPDTRTEQEMIEGVRQHCLDAVRMRLRADVPVAVYLSGGLDSSALAGMAAHLIKERDADLGNDHSGDHSRLKVFCVQFDKDSGADESEIARRTAQYLGVEFVPIHMDEQAIADHFEATVWNSEAPNPDANGIGKLAMSKVVNEKGFKVVLTGEGADEHFSGYSLFAADHLSEPDPAYPAYACSDADREAGFADYSRKLDIFTLGDVPKNTPLSSKRMLANTRIGPSLCTHTPVPFAPWTDAYAASDPETVLAESFEPLTYDKMNNKWHPLHSSQYIWTRSVFPNILLRYLGDNVDMVNHVESRTPFLDHVVAEYANNLPPSIKMKFDPETKTVREKNVLREAMKPFITDEIYNRPKHPYMGPVKYTADGPLYSVITKLVTKENVERLGFVDWAETEGLAHKAFVKHEHGAFRNVLSVAQFVVLSQRFGVEPAAP